MEIVMKKIVVWFGMLLLIVACASAPISVQSKHFGITVVVSASGIGTRPITVTLTGADKKTINDATITVTAVMNQHGMLSVPLTLTAHPDGTYTSDALDLNMAGEWQLQLHIVQSSVNDTIIIPVVVK
jgi:YtkA-like